jgi:hypothetical protein
MKHEFITSLIMFGLLVMTWFKWLTTSDSDPTKMLHFICFTIYMSALYIGVVIRENLAERENPL